MLDEAEHDSKNYQGRRLCLKQKAKAEADNANRGLDNSRYHAKTAPIARTKNKKGVHETTTHVNN